MLCFILQQAGLSKVVTIILHRSAISATPRIVFFTKLISDLATTPTTAILTAFCETLVQITTDNPLVELGPSDVFQTVERILMSVIFNEAESARSFLNPVQSHDQALYFTAFRE
jgi:hypothetical protein